MENILSKEETAALLQGIENGSVETERGAGKLHYRFKIPLSSLSG